MEPSSLIGKTVDGRYEILSSLGTGGMGEVYLAREIELDRLVAVKVLHTLIELSADSRSRFQREALAMSAMQHKNIVAFLRLGVWENHPYIVMEYLQGLTLRQLLADGRLPWQRALTIAMQVCDAMSCVHAHGITHRDLKPSNILLVPAESGELVKLMDFGLAGCLPDSVLPVQKLTMTGDLVGSLHYLSPEQACGAKSDYRSDIYSLGCVTYEAISGEPPLDAQDPVTLAHLHVHQPPKKLQEIMPNADLPPELDQVLSMAMAKDATKRYQSMHELRSDLEQLVAGKAVGTRNTGLLASPWQTAIVSVVTLSVISVLAFYASPHIVAGALPLLPQDSWMDKGLNWSSRLEQCGYDYGAGLVLDRLSELATSRHDILALIRVQVARTGIAHRQGQRELSQRWAQRSLETLWDYRRNGKALIEPAELAVAGEVAQSVAPVAATLNAESIESLKRLAGAYAQLPSLRYSFALSGSKIAQRIYSRLDVRRVAQMCELAGSLSALGKKNEACQILEAIQATVQTTTSQPTEVDVILLKGWIWLGDKAHADKVFHRIIQSIPIQDLDIDDPGIELMEKMSEEDQLTASVFARNDLYSHCPAFVLQYAFHLSRTKRQAKAISYLNKLVNSQAPRDIKLRAAIVNSSNWTAEGNYKEALRYCNLAYSLAREYPDELAEVLAIRSKAYACLRQDKESTADFEVASSLLPPGHSLRRLSLWESRLGFYRDRGMWPQEADLAKQTLAEALAIPASNTAIASSFHHVASSQLQLGDQVQAYANIDQALPFVECSPLSVQRSYFGDIFVWYLGLADWQRAARTARTMLALDQATGASERDICMDQVQIAQADTLIPDKISPTITMQNLWHDHEQFLLGHPELAGPALFVYQEALTTSGNSSKQQWLKVNEYAQAVLDRCDKDKAAAATKLSVLMILYCGQMQLSQHDQAQKTLVEANCLAGKGYLMQHSILLYRAFAALRLGHIDELRHHYEDAISLLERNNASLATQVSDTTKLADLLISAGRPDQAKIVLERFLTRYADVWPRQGALKLQLENRLKLCRQAVRG